MPRPKSHFRTGKSSHLLRDDHPAHHTKKPDLDKLIRGVKDALSGVVYLDDSYVCGIEASKSYGARPGVKISVFNPPNAEAA